MARKRKPLMSDEIKRLIQESGQTRYRIAMATGIDQASLSKFVNGERGITTDTLDRLAEHLGWRIVKDSPATPKKGK